MSFMHLFKGYWRSFGTLLLVTGGGILAAVSSKKLRSNLIGILNELRAPAFVMLFVLLENILLKQHAAAYSFARMKAVFILMLLAFAALSAVSAGFEKKQKIINSVVTAVFVLAAAYNLGGYLKMDNDYQWSADFRIKNEELAREIKSSYSSENSVVAQSAAVRGYTNMLFGRGVFEGVPGLNRSTLQHAIERDKQYFIYLIYTDDLLCDMYEYGDYIVYDVWSDKLVKSVDFSKTGAEYVTDGVLSAFFLTDENWFRGFSRTFTGFFIENTPSHHELYRVGAYIEVADNDFREIVHIEEYDEYLWVYLEGEPFKVIEFDSPMDLTVISTND